MAEALLTVEGLSKSFGGVVATDNLFLDVRADEIHALIGPNGAGKTTLIAQLSGMIRPDRGRIRFDGADITGTPAPERAKRGLARSFQITSVFRDFTCAENVALGVQARGGHSFRFWEAARTDPELQGPARAILEEVGLGHRADVLAGNLAHGEQRQLEIAMVLATGPKLLLLDEPMAGMGPADSERMTEYLRLLKGKYCILLVEHDMDAVFALADRITVLVYGRAIASGAPEEIRANEEVRDAYLGES
ncbi:MAG: ABC transporter ATP-binding protein [Gammaproteobacteria bacterium]|nr:ABC transporter ATP-binding protein [Gammaproteobacteria bacterium]NIR84889.1 ABC transporter ATP-binding protein [Gammaproteobacteria bacterium]NIR91738.1 ABC transporter ATP-binding protein [Gammaproteobacteria bacterium]NIU05936.1 ABC transporter ATP-binding protein [Gammaproteobacteria bacterium]NIV52983.1 ATP-binding cassette domain-containing protein [Gammaproteobacteria bacterium]